MMEIAGKVRLPYSQVVYWMKKYDIPRRTRSEANYFKYNPNGDPFTIKEIKTTKDLELFNLGIGLFLGEGTKKNKFNVILSNSNPKIIKLFIAFLTNICGVRKEKIKVALNIFDDVNLQEALKFWQKETKIPRSRFTSITVRKARNGTYKNKSKYGTVTIYVSNTKLKRFMDKCCSEVTNNFLSDHAFRGRDSSVGRAFHW